MTFGVSPKVTLKVTPNVTFWPEQVTFDPKSDSKVTFSVKKLVWGLLLGLLWGRPRKSLFSYFRGDFSFFGVSGVLGGQHFLKLRRQKHAFSQSTTPFACTLLEVPFSTTPGAPDNSPWRTGTPTNTMALMGCFPSLMGCFPGFAITSHYTSGNPLENCPLRKGPLKRFLMQLRAEKRH